MWKPNTESDYGKDQTSSYKPPPSKKKEKKITPYEPQLREIEMVRVALARTGWRP